MKSGFEKVLQEQNEEFYRQTKDLTDFVNRIRLIDQMTRELNEIFGKQ